MLELLKGQIVEVYPNSEGERCATSNAIEPGE
jgi:hypothetical protein